MSELDTPKPTFVRPDKMIHEGAVVDARWSLVLSSDETPQPGQVIPLQRWLDLTAAQRLPENVGVILEGDEDISALEAHLSSIPVVALHIPKFTDGRSYSHAYRLKRIWRYEGTVLAFGDVLRDQLVYMWRCGINSFYMRQDQDLEASLASFNLYNGFYQYNQL